MQPKVLLSSFNRYHIYQAGQELLKRRALSRLFTADLKPAPPVLRAHVKKYSPAAALAAKVFQQQKKLSFLVPKVWRLYDQWVADQITTYKEAHVFSGYSLYCLESLKQAARADLRTIVERHGTHILTQRANIEEEVSRWGYEINFQQNPYWANSGRMLEEYETADYVLTCSEYARSSFLACGFAPQRVVAVHMGCNFEPRVTLNEPKDIFRVLCIGHDACLKGVVYLAQAWKQAKFKKAELVIRSNVPAKLRQLFNDPSIRILGPLRGSKLLAAYQSAAVFCLPSVDEGFGMVVLEAMASGLPVVLSSNVGAKEVIREGTDGYIFPVRDVSALADCLTRLYEDQEKRRWMADNALARVRDLTWDAYGQKLFTWLQGILPYDAYGGSP